MRATSQLPLTSDKYSDFSTMFLMVDVGTVVGPEGAEQQRAARAESLMIALLDQHRSWIAGFATAPPRRAWGHLLQVPLVVGRSSAAQAAFVAAVQAQHVGVQWHGQQTRLPVSATPGWLPAGHVEVVMHGLPPECACRGVTEAVLRMCGYGAGAVQVVHERGGVVVGPSGVELPVPSLDTVVAVVTAPPTDPMLSRLPRGTSIEGRELQLSVRSCQQAAPAITLRRTQPTRAQVLDVVGAAHGLTAEARERGPAPVAAAATAGARAPGNRAGLGFGAPPPAPSPRVPPPAAQAPLPALSATAVAAAIAQGSSDTDAHMLEQPPDDQPVAGALLLYLEEADLSTEQRLLVLQSVRAGYAAEWAACQGASCAAELSRHLRQAVYDQVRIHVGNAAAAAFELAPAASLPEGMLVEPEEAQDCAMREAPEAPAAAGAGVAAGPAAALPAAGLPRRSPRAKASATNPDGSPKLPGSARQAALDSPYSASARAGSGGRPAG